MNKTLSPFRYLQQLQKEYIICRHRQSIYTDYSKNDEAFWAKTAKLKQDRIHELAETHNFKTIFTNEELKEKCVKDTLPNLETGMPLFEGIQKKDIYAYFLGGSGYVAAGESSKIYEVKEVLYDRGMVVLFHRSTGEEAEATFNLVRRLYTEKIF